MMQQSVIDHLTEPYLMSFYGWWQFVVCLFGFFALMAIWWHIGRKQKDSGQVWLALSILFWSFSGALEISCGAELQEANGPLKTLADSLLKDPGNETRLAAFTVEYEQRFDALSKAQKAAVRELHAWGSILSLCNSLCILLALPWFRYIPTFIKKYLIGPNRSYWNLIVGLPFLFALIFTYSSMRHLAAPPPSLVSQPDFFYSALTLMVLGPVLWQSFAKRRLRIMAWLSLFCILITLAAQVYKLDDPTLNLTLFSAVFKTTLIMIFFALALSWVKELAEHIVTEPEQLFLSFHQERTTNNRTERWIILKGFPGQSDRKILLTRALYDLLVSFAQKRAGKGDDWLEIKPKGESRSGKVYDIQDYNEIRRLTEALLDGIFGKGNWAKHQHFEPFRNSFFETSRKRERKIRLAIPPGNIALSA